MKYLIASCSLIAAMALAACTEEQPAGGGERISNSSTLPPDGEATPEDVAEPPGSEDSGEDAAPEEGGGETAAPDETDDAPSADEAPE